MPEFYSPFPAALNPHVEAVQRGLNQWMQDQRFLRTHTALERFKASKFAWVAARAHPKASFESVLLVATFMSWLFVVDDLCDEAGLGKEPARLKAQHHELIKRMKHPRPVRGDESPLVVGLAELWPRLRLRAAPGWVGRFIHTFEDYAQGCVWEAENRAHGRVPSLAEYLERRRQTSALYVFFDLIELAEQVTLPSGVLEQLRPLQVRANDGVAWFNDILSLEKEVRAGDVHNLVVILQHEQRLSVQAAVDEAARLFNARIREYVELERALPSYGAELDVLLQRYLRGLRCWVRGNMDWSYETGRYGYVRPPRTLERAAS